MAKGFESTVRLTLNPVEPDSTVEPRDVVWTVSMRDGPLRANPHGFDHEMTLRLTRVGTGETIELAVDGNASTWDTFRRLAESGVPELADLFGGQRASMID